MTVSMNPMTPQNIETTNMQRNRQVIADRKIAASPLKRIATENPIVEEATTKNMLKTMSIQAPEYDTRLSTITMNNINNLPIIKRKVDNDDYFKERIISWL